MTDYTGIAVRLRGSISDDWSGGSFAADADNAEEAAKALIEARDTIADMLAALKLCAAYLGELPPGGTREPLYQAYSAAVHEIEKATGEL